MNPRPICGRNLHHRTSSTPCLAGASYCHAAISLFSRPVHLLAAPQYLCLAGASHRLAALSYLEWHIPSRATISSAGRRIPIAVPPYHILAGIVPRRPIIFWPAHPIATPPLPILAGASDCLFWQAHPIATPTYHIWAGASNRCATIAYLGWCIRSPISAGASHRCANLSYFGRRIQSPCHHCLSQLAHPIAYFGWRIPSLCHRPWLYGGKHSSLKVAIC